MPAGRGARPAGARSHRGRTGSRSCPDARHGPARFADLAVGPVDRSVDEPQPDAPGSGRSRRLGAARCACHNGGTSERSGGSAAVGDTETDRSSPVWWRWSASPSSWACSPAWPRSSEPASSGSAEARLVGGRAARAAVALPARPGEDRGGGRSPGDPGGTPSQQAGTRALGEAVGREAEEPDQPLCRSDRGVGRGAAVPLGHLPGGEGSILDIEYKINDQPWREFNLDVNVSGQTFATYVYTSNTGTIKWRDVGQVPQQAVQRGHRQARLTSGSGPPAYVQPPGPVAHPAGAGQSDQRRPPRRRPRAGRRGDRADQQRAAGAADVAAQPPAAEELRAADDRRGVRAERHHDPRPEPVADRDQQRITAASPAAVVANGMQQGRRPPRPARRVRRRRRGRGGPSASRRGRRTRCRAPRPAAKISEVVLAEMPRWSAHSGSSPLRTDREALITITATPRVSSVRRWGEQHRPARDVARGAPARAAIGPEVGHQQRQQAGAPATGGAEQEHPPQPARWITPAPSSGPTSSPTRWVPPRADSARAR